MRSKVFLAVAFLSWLTQTSARTQSLLAHTKVQAPPGLPWVWTRDAIARYWTDKGKPCFVQLDGPFSGCEGSLPPKQVAMSAPELKRLAPDYRWRENANRLLGYPKEWFESWVLADAREPQREFLWMPEDPLPPWSKLDIEVGSEGDRIWVVCEAIDVPVSALLWRLSEQTGQSLVAQGDVADLRVVVLCRQLALKQLRLYLAQALHARWRETAEGSVLEWSPITQLRAEYMRRRKYLQAMNEWERQLREIFAKRDPATAAYLNFKDALFRSLSPEQWEAVRSPEGLTIQGEELPAALAAFLAQWITARYLGSQQEVAMSGDPDAHNFPSFPPHWYVLVQSNRYGWVNVTAVGVKWDAQRGRWKVVTRLYQ